jgi:hypothetical protein
MTMVWVCVDEEGLEVATVRTYQTCERPLARPAAFIAAGLGSDGTHCSQPVASKVMALEAASRQGIAGAERPTGSWIQLLLAAAQLMTKNEPTANDAAKPAASGAPPRGRPV